MAGYLKIENSYSDAQAVVLTLEASGKNENGSRSRMGKSLKIDIGREAEVKLPDFLQTDVEQEAEGDTEPYDQKVERLSARIRELEKANELALVPSDETDHGRMVELMTALHNERQKSKGLDAVLKFVENEFNKIISEASEDQLQEMGQRHHTAGAGESRGDHRSALKESFQNGDPSEKISLYESARSALDEEETRRASSKHHEEQQHLLQDKDARHVGDFYRGADSTTDLNDTAQTREEDSDDDETSDTEARDNVQEQQTGQDNTQSSTGEGTHTTTVAGSKGSEEDDSHKETQEKADEAVEEANKAEEQASTSREKAEETKEAADNDASTQEDMDTGGGSDSTTERGKVEDRPVKMDDEDSDSASTQEDDDDFRSRVNGMRNAHLDEVEGKYDDLSGEGNQKERKQALKDKYDNSDEQGKKDLSDAVDAALEA
jgi:hypothetical protein